MVCFQTKKFITNFIDFILLILKEPNEVHGQYHVDEKSNGHTHDNIPYIEVLIIMLKI